MILRIAIANSSLISDGKIVVQFKSLINFNHYLSTQLIVVEFFINYA